MVVVEGECPAELLGGRNRLGSDRHGAVGRLPGAGDGAATACREEALSHASRRVAGELRGERERVRTAGANDDFGHVHEPTGPPGHGGKRVLRRVRPRPTVAAVARPLTPVDVLIGLALVAAVVVLFVPGHHGNANAILADSVRTPGVLNPDVTQANIRSTICRHGWTATIRPPVSYTNALKRRQMRQYAETGSMSDYQEDHLISLEMGGNPTDPRNLWPEPYPRAAEMDKTENELNSEICDGTLTLAQAQQREDTIKHTQG